MYALIRCADVNKVFLGQHGLRLGSGSRLTNPPCRRPSPRFFVLVKEFFAFVLGYRKRLPLVTCLVVVTVVETIAMP